MADEKAIPPRTGAQLLFLIPMSGGTSLTNM